MRLTVIVCIFLALIALLGCSSSLRTEPNPTSKALLVNPLPTPNSIVFLSPLPSDQLNGISEICVGIDQGALLELGDNADGLANSLKDRISIFVDGNQLQKQTAQFLHRGPEFAKYDSYGNLIGTYGMSRLCFSVQLERGIHAITFVIESTSGTQQQKYVWAFENW